MFDKKRFSTGEFLDEQPQQSSPESQTIVKKVPAWYNDNKYSLDFRNYMQKIYGDNDLNEKTIEAIHNTWKTNPSQIITAANEKTKAANAKALQERRASEEKRREIRSKKNQDDAKYAVKVESKAKPAATLSNDFSNIANFNEAFRQASKAGLKTFIWKKTKGNPSGMFSTELATKKKPDSKPATQQQEPLEEVDDTLDVEVTKIPIDKSKINKNSWEKDLYEVIPNAVTEPSTGAKLMENINNQVSNSLAYQKYLARPQQDFNIWAGLAAKPTFQEYVSGIYKKGGTMNKVQYFAGGGQPQAQNAQADDFMKSILNGDQNAISQLIQAANQGNKEAATLIETILKEEQKGNTQVAKAASVIKQLINGAVSAKWGSKLQYMKSLKFAKGGKAKSCPVCEQQVEMKKCGGKKAKKRYFGGII